MPRTRLYRNGVLEAEGFPIADVSDHLEDESATVWFDLCRPDAKDLAAISEELGLHALAVEDAIAEHERPKLDRYQTHLFVTAYAVTLDTASGQLDSCEVAAFVTDRALVTVRKDERFDIDTVVKRWDDSPDLTKYGVGFLLYGLLDYVVDTHFEAVQALDSQIEALEDELFDDRPRDREMQRRTFQLRARAWSPPGGWCCRCARWSTRCCAATCMWSTRRCSRTSRMCTTTCCARRSGPSRCGTWSPRSWRPI